MVANKVGDPSLLSTMSGSASVLIVAMRCLEATLEAFIPQLLRTPLSETAAYASTACLSFSQTFPALPTQTM